MKVFFRHIFICRCAAKAIFYCPTMNSHRPRSQNTSKEQALIPEKDSQRIRPRCHVSLEKSSKNYKPLEKWAKPNLLPDITPQPANFSGEYFRRICHVVEPDPPELSAVFSCHSGWPKQGWFAVWSSSLTGWQKPAQFKTRIVSDVLLLSYLDKIGLMAEAGQALVYLYSEARLYKGARLAGLSQSFYRQHLRADKESRPQQHTWNSEFFVLSRSN